MEVVKLIREGERARLHFARSDKSVNVLDEVCVAQLEQCLSELEADLPAVLVLESGMPGCFIAGADLRMIEAVSTAGEATRLAERGQAVCRRLEQLSAVSIAVVQGACMGGGLELAMACDHIVAVEDAKTQLALPEIRIGIHPGFGGCVRLPGRVGWPKAVEMILTGRALDAKRAKRSGLADMTCHDGQITVAIEHLAAKGKQVKKMTGPWWFHIWPLRIFFYHKARQQALAKFSDLDVEEAYPAVIGALDLLKDIYGMSDGLAYAREAGSLGRLAITPSCKNLIRCFFLGDALKKQDAAKKGKAAAAAMQQAAVFGAGVMGSGIGWVAARHLDVDLHDVSEDALGRGMKALSRFAKRDPKRLQRIRPVLNRSGLAQADVVVEAVLETLEVKQELWRELEEKLGKDTLLLTNTSSLSVSDQQQGLKHPGRLAGLHFFNPAPKMPLVEVVAGAKSHKKSVQTAAALAVRWGKYPVVVADKPGFLVNRCLMPYMSAALRLVERGQRPEHIDGALRNFGMPMGAIELADRVGLDICRHVGEHLSAAYGARMSMPQWFGEMVDDGLLGEKSGRGFYCYAQGKRGDVNEAVARYVTLTERHEHEFDADIAEADVPPMRDADIVDVCLLPMLAEALACLDEKVVESGEHLDAAFVYGIGFPPFRGGLLHYFAACAQADLEQKFATQGLPIPANLKVLYG